ncbi:MAG: hypothetical protein WDW38_007482 [Sanguina aurantia]
MGNSSGKETELGGRAKAITGGNTTAKRGLPKAPLNAIRPSPDDSSFIEAALAKLLLFNKLDPHVQRKVVQEMYERNVGAGEILIKEGDTGAAATELYVTKSGKFEVLQKRQGQNIRVNMKERGDCFGEISLMYDQSRTATVAATTDAIVWVLDRSVFRWGGQGQRHTPGALETTRAQIGDQLGGW